MGARTRRKKSERRGLQGGRASRRARYTATEWFMVVLGAAIVILFAGLLITSLLD